MGISFDQSKLTPTDRQGMCQIALIGIHGLIKMDCQINGDSETDCDQCKIKQQPQHNGHKSADIRSPLPDPKEGKTGDHRKHQQYNR